MKVGKSPEMEHMFVLIAPGTTRKPSSFQRLEKTCPIVHGAAIQHGTRFNFPEVFRRKRKWRLVFPAG